MTSNNFFAPVMRYRRVSESLFFRIFLCTVVSFSFHKGHIFWFPFSNIKKTIVILFALFFIFSHKNLYMKYGGWKKSFLILQSYTPYQRVHFRWLMTDTIYPRFRFDYKSDDHITRSTEMRMIFALNTEDDIFEIGFIF